MSKTQQDVAEDQWNKVKGALNLKDLSMDISGSGKRRWVAYLEDGPTL